MRSSVVYDGAKDTMHMTSERATAHEDLDLLTDGFVTTRSELVRCMRDGVQRVVAVQLASGHSVFSSGVAANAETLFMRTPDGRRAQYRVRTDGVREIVRNGEQ